MKKKKSSSSKLAGMTLKKRGLPSKRVLYQKIAGRADELVNELFKLSKNKNKSVAVSACRVLIERVIPSLRSQEYTGLKKPHTGVVFLPAMRDEQEEFNAWKKAGKPTKKKPVEADMKDTDGVVEEGNGEAIKQALSQP